MIFFYFSLVLSIIFTLLLHGLRIITQCPKTRRFLTYFKGFHLIPKLVIISQIFWYRFFGVFSAKHKIKYNIIKYGSLVLLVINILFKVRILKGSLILNPYLIVVICLILCLHTIFRSFVTFSIIIHQARLFSFLHSQKFFSEIQKIPYWDNYVKELFEQNKTRERLGL